MPWDDRPVEMTNPYLVAAARKAFETFAELTGHAGEWDNLGQARKLRWYRIAGEAVDAYDQEEAKGAGGDPGWSSFSVFEPSGKLKDSYVPEGGWLIEDRGD